MRRGGRKIIVLVLGACLFGGVAALPVWAGGKDERKTADSLIAKRQYSDAIRMLTTMARRNDEEFDFAQHRFESILARMYDFNELAHTLFDVVENDPEDAQTILSLSNRLNDMGGARTEEMRRYISQIHILARFVVNRRAMERILAEGRALLDAEDYVGAMNKYAEGLTLYQTEVFAAGYGPAIENTVRTSLDAVNRSVAALNTAARQTEPGMNTMRGLETGGAGAGLSSAAQSVAQSAQELAAAGSAYQSLIPELDRIVGIKNSVASSNTALVEQGKNLPVFDKDIITEGQYFFQFAPIFLHGRANQDIREGMLGAIDGLWTTLAPPVDNVMSTISEEAWGKIITALLSYDYAAASPLLNTFAASINLPFDLYNKWYRFSETDDLSRGMIFGAPVLQQNTQEFLRYQSVGRSTNYLGRTLRIGNQFVTVASRVGPGFLQMWKEDRISVDDALEREREVRRSYEAMLRDAAGLLGSLNNEAAAFSQAVGTGAASRDTQRYFNDAKRVLTSLGTEIERQNDRAAVRQYSIAYGDLEAVMIRLEDETAAVDTFIEGIPWDVGNGDPDFHARFPDRTLAVVNAATAGLQGSIEEGRVLLTGFGEENAHISRIADIQGLQYSAGEVVSRLENLSRHLEQSAAEAADMIARADVFYTEANSLYYEAAAAVTGEDFELAREQLELSSAQYLASLDLQESEPRRREWNERLFTLRTEIARLEAEAVIREVRRLLNTARDTYFSGDFPDAESVLVEAQERWGRINTDDNPEVVYWLNLVRGAMSLRGGRTIPVTAPLYPQMSQLLSDANRNYNEGVRLITGNQREDGLLKFVQARAITQEVRLVFPVNQEAGILELRMDQVTDPVAFNESFARRFEDAVTGARAGSRQSYADLQNLAEINPAYRGMQAALAQAEIDVGLRLPRADTQVATQAQALALAAQQRFVARNPAQYPAILEDLNRALRLNPNNTLAAQVRDRVMVEMGTGMLVVSSVETEQGYQQAVRYLQQGNPLLAMQVLRRLLEQPGNANSTRLLELQRRIQSML